jgi:hypothetical protein
MFVLRGKDRRQSAEQSGQRSKGKVQSENKKKSPCRGRRFFCSSKRPDCLWGLPWVRFTRYRHSIPYVQRAGREVDRSYTSGAEVE